MQHEKCEGNSLGLGAMGGGIGKMLCKKQGVDIVGAIDIGAKLGNPEKDGDPHHRGTAPSG